MDIPNSGDHTSDYLRATNFGFSIPTGAIINGIEVQIMRQSSSNGGNNSINDVDLNLLKSRLLLDLTEPVQVTGP